MRGRGRGRRSGGPGPGPPLATRVCVALRPSRTRLRGYMQHIVLRSSHFASKQPCRYMDACRRCTLLCVATACGVERPRERWSAVMVFDMTQVLQPKDSELLQCVPHQKKDVHQTPAEVRSAGRNDLEASAGSGDLVQAARRDRQEAEGGGKNGIARRVHVF